MIKNCVYCGCSDNLNTSFVITLDDGSKVSVDICDAHAEDATVKTAKIAYTAKQQQIQSLLQQAAALGLQLAPVGQNGLVTLTDTSPKPQVVPQKPKREIIQPEQEQTEYRPTDLIPTHVVDNKSAPLPTVNAVGNVPGGQSSIDLKSVAGQLPESALLGEARPVIAEGRAGTPVRFVQYRRDGLGTTQINIANVETDASLQARFKNMAKDTERDKIPDFINGGYNDTIVTCPMCRGSCVIRRSGAEVPCPNCHGAGFLSNT